ncbi:MAG: hypothetical protein RIR97_1050 [Pseudomonadota bacterium]|jgi:hypothetical protein
MKKILAAELFGRFRLVSGGCGSAVLADGFQALGINPERDHGTFTLESWQKMFSRLSVAAQ